MSKLVEGIRATDHVAGNPEAKVTLVEYGDYQCPYCGMAHPIVKEILAKLGGEIRFVFRNFPISEIHPHALHAAAAAEFAADQGKFWEMHDYIFEHQKALEDSDLTTYAHHFSLDPVDLIEALEAPAIADRIQHDFMTGVRSGVNGTPTFFINGQRHDQSWELDPLAQALLKAIQQ